jgi:hypothetical protein
MTIANAYGFLVLGTGVELMPKLCPSAIASPTGVGELWLIFMGAVLMLTGGLFLLQAAWRQVWIVWGLSRLFAARPAEGSGAAAPVGSRVHS